MKTKILLQQVPKWRIHEGVPYASMVQRLIKHMNTSTITGGILNYTYFILLLSECILNMKS
jgi:hypothetical protein